MLIWIGLMKKQHESNRGKWISRRTLVLGYCFYKRNGTCHSLALDLHCAIRLSAITVRGEPLAFRHEVRNKELSISSTVPTLKLCCCRIAPTSTFSWYSAENFWSAQALTMELGQVAKIGENQLDKLTAFDLAMRKFDCWSWSLSICLSELSCIVAALLCVCIDDFDFMFSIL